MYLADSSVWIALALADHVHNRTARGWLDTIVEPSSVLFCRSTQQSFLRLLTTAAVLARFGNPPLTNQQAWSEFEALLADDRIAFQHREPWDLEAHWKDFSARDTASSKLWMDAYLAAFARAGGYQMVTTDAGFAQFDGLDLVLLGSQRG